ncbi:outer envelope pore protein 24A, chloroplastic-like [Gossypium australe]|uniref:Outer envelope pore protein 24A, chloroplastic-like n=1 Tax=Gossypium australe TaxID=47621 RepID=A0A5B6W657_9ROSI|nr:outer envelope pore protein 24A, chloroplastic-like [Gossypium australe]
MSRTRKGLNSNQIDESNEYGLLKKLSARVKTEGGYIPIGISSLQVELSIGLSISAYMNLAEESKNPKIIAESSWDLEI